MIRFVLVSGQVPRSKVYCALCSEEIQQIYVREVEAGRLYCDTACYVCDTENLTLALDRATRQASRMRLNL